MKKAIIAVAAVAATLGANAEGYQVNTLSAKQLGMAHTGTAMHLGAESMYFNPAGMAFMDKTLDMSVSVTGIFADAKAVHDGIAYKTDNNASTPIMAAAGFRIFDSLKAGVAFYTPYGSSINWTDNWPGAVLNQSVDLKVYTLQPTLAWRIMPGLSVGAGITMSWGSVNLDKGLVSAATADRLSTALGVGPVFGNTTPASVNLNGDASLRVGFNVGAMWDINRRITVGASFRSQVMMKVKAGDATLTYAGEAARKLLGNTLDVLDRANFAAEMPAPWVLSVGASCRPVDRLTLALDARLTGWSAYKTLDIEFLSEQLTPYNQHLTKNYRNAWAVSAGAQYALTDRLDLRAGVMVDTTPVSREHYNPETPGMAKIEPAVGLSFRPLPQLSVDVAFMYVAGLGEDNASVTYTDLVAASMPALGLPGLARFTADYSVHAFIPSIGVSYCF